LMYLYSCLYLYSDLCCFLFFLLIIVLLLLLTNKVEYKKYEQETWSVVMLTVPDVYRTRMAYRLWTTKSHRINSRSNLTDGDGQTHTARKREREREKQRNPAMSPDTFQQNCKPIPQRPKKDSVAVNQLNAVVAISTSRPYMYCIRIYDTIC